MFVDIAEANAENPGLKKITWPTSKKAQLAEILSEDYMSSEESDVEGKFLVKELSWESRKLEKRRQQLDKFYNEQHSKRTMERLVKRVRGEVLSAQQKPVDCPDWACINTNNSSSISTQG